MPETLELMKKYNVCQECGNDKVRGEPSQGSLSIENEIFTRKCKCGWSVVIDRRIKHCATLTKRKNNKLVGGIYEVSIHGQLMNKYLPLIELKKRAGVKRINQHKKIESYLNSPEGREWALEVEAPTVENC